MPRQETSQGKLDGFKRRDIFKFSVGPDTQPECVTCSCISIFYTKRRGEYLRFLHVCTCIDILQSGCIYCW